MLTDAQYKELEKQIRLEIEDCHQSALSLIDLHVDTNELADEVDHAAAEKIRLDAIASDTRRRQRLAALKVALDRLERKTIASCGDCSDNISFKRLQARPTAVLCVECQEDRERDVARTFIDQDDKLYGIQDEHSETHDITQSEM